MNDHSWVGWTLLTVIVVLGIIIWLWPEQR